ncbi:MAG TPA: hypothetical protein VFG31_06815 [Conexibacter sp.]|nr:hypothetical protein [Conexibacter sp.]
MHRSRHARIAVVVATVALAAPAMVGASDSTPVGSMRASLSPSRDLTPGTPVTFTLDTRFTYPPGEDFVLQRLVYLFPRGTVVNGRLFPACDVAALRRAHGHLSACPAGSRIGDGVASGTAVALGVRSSGRVTLFNGPGGRSIVINVAIQTPALINASFAAPFVTLHGRWSNKLTVTPPDALKRVVDGDIVTSRIRTRTGATRMIHGVRRGYVEAQHCPRSGRARIHGDFTFDRGASTSTDTFVPC